MGGVRGRLPEAESLLLLFSISYLGDRLIARLQTEQRSLSVKFTARQRSPSATRHHDIIQKTMCSIGCSQKHPIIRLKSFNVGISTELLLIGCSIVHSSTFWTYSNIHIKYLMDQNFKIKHLRSVIY